MKLAVISFTERGSRLNRSVSELLRREGIDVESTALAKYAESSGLPPLPVLFMTGRAGCLKAGMPCFLSEPQGSLCGALPLL